MSLRHTTLSLVLGLSALAAHAGFDEAKAALDRSDWDTARAEAAQLVESKDHRGGWVLAHMAVFKLGGSTPTPGAIKALQVSSAKGLPDAQYDLGWAYLEGDRGVARDRNKGHALMMEAAKKGLARAQLGVANNFVAGNGTPYSNETAVVWATAAAKQGYGPAYSMLATMHYNGIGVPVNYVLSLAFTRVGLALNLEGSDGYAEALQVLKNLKDTAQAGAIRQADVSRADSIARTVLDSGFAAGLAEWRQGTAPSSAGAKVSSSDPTQRDAASRLPACTPGMDPAVPCVGPGTR